MIVAFVLLHKSVWQHVVVIFVVILDCVVETVPEEQLCVQNVFMLLLFSVIVIFFCLDIKNQTFLSSII